MTLSFELLLLREMIRLEGPHNTYRYIEKQKAKLITHIRVIFYANRWRVNINIVHSGSMRSANAITDFDAGFIIYIHIYYANIGTTLHFATLYYQGINCVTDMSRLRFVARYDYDVCACLDLRVYFVVYIDIYVKCILLNFKSKQWFCYGHAWFLIMTAVRINFIDYVYLQLIIA